MLAVALTITPEDVAAAYRERGDLSPVQLGAMMLRCRRELGLSSQEMARQAGITAGTVHHYTSLLSLPVALQDALADGRLTMKEGRSLVDLCCVLDPDPRFAEIADLFVSGRLSSVYAEHVVAVAKHNPKASVDDLIVLAFVRAKTQPRKWDGPVVVARRPRVDPKALQAHILALAGEVEAWGMQERCEVERLPVICAARVLDDRLHRLALVTATANDAPVASTGGNGVGNRRLALLLEEPRKVLAGQEGLAI